MNVFRHLGDLGDCIACLPVIRQLGGGRLILGNRNGRGAREPMTPARFDVIAPLLRVQDYITDVTLQDDASGVTHCFADFRTKPMRSEENLATWQAAFFSITSIDLAGPWLFAHPSQETQGKAVFARSARYHGVNFNWLEMMEKYPAKLFVGLPDEHAAFCSQFGSIDFRPTANFLELAELISGCEIFCGNQSAPFWIAAGLAHKLVLEMDQWQMNRNCIVQPRPNAEYRC